MIPNAYIFYCHDESADQAPFVLRVLLQHEAAIEFARTLLARWSEYRRVEIQLHEQVVAVVARDGGCAELILVPNGSAGMAGSVSLH